MADLLDFEKPLAELETRIAELQARESRPGRDGEIHRLQERLARLRRRTYSNLSAWQRTQVARHPRRPRTLDYVRLLIEDWVELHGDRVYGDDRAMVGGLGRFDGEPVIVIGHQKGRDTRENLARNFGMPHPEGYRKALRLMELAEKFRKPILAFIDTPGAYPGLGAEERGQAEAIARNLRVMAGLKTPVIAVVIGEGGSGGALAIGVGDRVLMLEHAVYSVISPEGCAAILWGDRARAPDASELMRMTASDLLRLGVIDAIVPEPLGGAHRDWERAAANLRMAVRDHLWPIRARTGEELVRERYEKFRTIGAWQEEDLPTGQR
jgi:acetyl-CoA carboxylase carboxyl transferase subunit alpha